MMEQSAKTSAYLCRTKSAMAVTETVASQAVSSGGAESLDVWTEIVKETPA